MYEKKTGRGTRATHTHTHTHTRTHHGSVRGLGARLPVRVTSARSNPHLAARGVIGAVAVLQVASDAVVRLPHRPAPVLRWAVRALVAVGRRLLVVVVEVGALRRIAHLYHADNCI